MTTDLELRLPQAVTLSSDQLSYIAGTEFVPPGLRGNLPAILACVAMGRELGIGDMVALKSIHVIDGKATFSAELMVQLVRRQGHSIQGSVTQDEATVVGCRADNGDKMTVTWTLAMADRAGLLGKSNWRKYPESMLWARAASQLCRMLFPDCFAGATYTLEEIESSVGDARPPGVNVEPSAIEKDDAPGTSTDSGSAGVPTAVEHPTAPVPQAGGTPEPATSVEEIAAAAEGLPAVDMADPDIPFGDAPPVRYITERQRTRLFTIASKAGVEEDAVRDVVRELTGQESTKLIPAGNVYDGVIAAIQAKGQA